MVKGPKPVKVVLSEEEQGALEQVARRYTTPQQIVKRAKIVQLAAAGKRNVEIGRELGVCVDMVRLWRGRWVEMQHIPLNEMGVEKKLSDLARSGSPGKFSAEQVTQIIAVACEEPEDSERPVSHWAPKELAAEVVKRGIVESISERQVGRFLKYAGIETPSEPVLAKHNRERP